MGKHCTVIPIEGYDRKRSLIVYIPKEQVIGRRQRFPAGSSAVLQHGFHCIPEVWVADSETPRSHFLEFHYTALTLRFQKSFWFPQSNLLGIITIIVETILKIHPLIRTCRIPSFNTATTRWLQWGSYDCF